MRTTTRTLTASLLSLPLAVGALAPAQAAPPERYSASGTFAGAYGTLVGELDGLDGNVHIVEVAAQMAKDYTDVQGSLVSYDCPEGVTEPWSDEEGPLCGLLGYYQLVGDGATATIDRKGTSATINGPLDIIEVECDEMDFDMECDETKVGTLTVNLALTATTKKAAVNRSSYSYRDPGSGLMVKVVTTDSTRDAFVSGTVAGKSFAEAYGRIGTFSYRESYQQR